MSERWRPIKSPGSAQRTLSRSTVACLMKSKRRGDSRGVIRTEAFRLSLSLSSAFRSSRRVLCSTGTGTSIRPSTKEERQSNYDTCAICLRKFSQTILTVVLTFVSTSLSKFLNLKRGHRLL